MGLVIGDDISKITLAGQVLYDRDVQNSAWLECPDEGEAGDFSGLTLMKWDSTTKTARFKSNAKVQVSAYYTISDPKKRLTITLPTGYHFVEDAKTAVFYNAYAGYDYTSNPYKISTEGAKLYAQLTNNYQNANYFYVCVPSTNGSAIIPFDSEVTFKVDKD